MGWSEWGRAGGVRDWWGTWQQQVERQVGADATPLLAPFLQHSSPTLLPTILSCVQVLAASGSELLVVRGEQDGRLQMGSFVDTAVYTK